MSNLFFNIAHAIEIENPLGVETIQELIENISGYIYGLSAAVATVMVLIGAFQILTAGGDAARYKKGKDTIIYTVIGLAIILLAGGIVSLVSGVLGQGGDGGVPRRIDVGPAGPERGVDTVPLPTRPPTFVPPPSPLEPPPTLPA